MDLASPEIYYFLAALLGAGALAGFTAGLFGVGGGIVLVPTFFTLLPYFHTDPQVVMHMAVGTSLALILPGAVMGSKKQFKLGNLELRVFRSWLPPILVGVVAGVILLNFLSTKILKIIFSGYLWVATVYAIIQRPPPEGNEGLPPVLWQRIVGFFTGSISVLLGIGGGTFTVPFFKFSHYPLKKAIALSTATTFWVGLGGAVGTILDGWGTRGRPEYSVGYVSLPAFILLSPLMMVFTPLGSQTAHVLPQKALKIIYVAFLGAMAGYMLIKILS